VAYSLSYRDLEELMQERGYAVDHSTVQRWVVHYAPRIEKAFRKNKKPAGNRWRLDKRIIRPMLGFKSFRSAHATLAGIELWRMLKKNQGKSSLPAWEQFYILGTTG
jgi:transposase-like protein